MFRRIISISIVILITISFLSFLPISANALRRPSCCEMNHNIDLEDVDVKTAARLAPGLTTEYEAIDRQATWPFNDGDIVGDVSDEDNDDVIDAGETDCNLGTSGPFPLTVATPVWGMVCLMDSVYTVTDFVFWLALSLSIIMGIVSGFYFFTSAGEPYKIERARSVLTWVIVGTVVAVAAKLITALIISIVL